MIAHDRPGISNQENPSTLCDKYLTRGFIKSFIYCDKLEELMKFSLITDSFQIYFWLVFWKKEKTPILEKRKKSYHKSDTGEERKKM